jgi:hypothetical protein
VAPLYVKATAVSSGTERELSSLRPFCPHL